MFGVLILDTKEDIGFFSRLMLPIGIAAISSSVESEGMAIYRLMAISVLPCENQKRIERRAKRALLQLKAAGVHRVIVPDNLRDLLPNMGLVPILGNAALEAVALQAVTKLGKLLSIPLDRMCVEVNAISQRELSSAAAALAPCVRALRFVPKPSNALSTQLLNTYGITCMGEVPEDVQIIRLWMSGQRPAEGIVLHMAGGETCSNGFMIELSAPNRIMSRIPKGVDKNLFLSALFQHGGIASRELRVAEVKPT